MKVFATRVFKLLLKDCKRIHSHLLQWPYSGTFIYRFDKCSLPRLVLKMHNFIYARGTFLQLSNITRYINKVICVHLLFKNVFVNVCITMIYKCINLLEFWECFVISNANTWKHFFMSFHYFTKWINRRHLICRSESYIEHCDLFFLFNVLFCVRNISS